MPHQPLHAVLHQLRRVVARERTDELSDAQLLDDFVQRRDEAAFELLVWRHAGLVLGTCRRLLRDRHEAEDAFQATFLVLIRKAATISRRDSLGSWLHRVAVRIAQRARAQAARRMTAALPEEVPAPEPKDDLLWRDLRPVLDEEVSRLPEKYRRPFVLCYLEGNTNEQAARQLGCPRGTILSRLARGRERLRVRLARRGVVSSLAALGTVLACASAEAAVPAAVVSIVVKAAIPVATGTAAAGLVSARAAAWTQGVLNAMLLTKIKIAAAVVLVLALAATGAGWLIQPTRADSRVAQAERERRPADPARGTDSRGTPSTEVRGILKAIDAAKATVTLMVNAREEASDKTYALAKTVEVGLGTGMARRGGAYREGKLSDLAPGAWVVLQLTSDQKAVECILAEGPTVRGVLKSVDAGKSTITLTLRSGGRGRGEEVADEEKTYAVGKNAEVGVDDGRGRTFSIKEVKLADLPTGAIVTLKLAADLKETLSVMAEGPTVGGVVKSVDAGKRQITLTTPPTRRGDDMGEETTYTLAAGADLFFDDNRARRFVVKQGQLADLPAGAVAMLHLSPDQKEVTSLRAEGPMVGGLFKVADPKKNTITLIVRPARGDTPEEDKTFELAPSAHITIDGKDGKLADLKAEDNGPPVGLKLSLDGKLVQSVNVGTGAGRRER